MFPVKQKQSFGQAVNLKLYATTC